MISTREPIVKEVKGEMLVVGEGAAGNTPSSHACQLSSIIGGGGGPLLHFCDLMTVMLELSALLRW
jgi:hypothetical protein